MTKAEKFVKGITDIIVSCGGTRLSEVYGNSLYPDQCYNVETTGGALQVTIALKPEEKNPDFLTIFCKFRNPAKAVMALTNDSDARLNSYSGKWNFHYPKKHKLEDIFCDFGSQLKEIALLGKKV